MKNVWLIIIAALLFPATLVSKASGLENAEKTKNKSAKPISLIQFSLKPYVSAGLVYEKSMNFAGFGMSGSRGNDLKVGLEVMPIFDIEMEYLDMKSFLWTSDRIGRNNKQIHEELHFAILAKMANANLKYPLKIMGVKMIPYVGAGTGRAKMSARSITSIVSPSLLLDDKDKDDSPCYKLSAGLKMEVTKNIFMQSEFVHFHSKFSNRNTDVLKGKVVNNGFVFGMEIKY